MVDTPMPLTAHLAELRSTADLVYDSARRWV